jgi:VIT1/CCC1 family predicted Fe2+/Mn2+ transporter
MMGRSSSRRADLLIDLMIGFSDGLVIAFAIVTGIAAFFTIPVIINVILVSITLGAFAMGMSRSLGDADAAPNYMDLGLSESTEKHISEQIAIESDQWQSDPRSAVIEKSARSKSSSLNIAFAYIAGGLIPLIPFWLLQDKQAAWNASLALTSVSLLILALLKSRFTQQSFLFIGLRTIVIALLASGAAFLIANIFN